jgi:hypothetical protein
MKKLKEHHGLKKSMVFCFSVDMAVVKRVTLDHLYVDCGGTAGVKRKSGALQRNSMLVFRSKQFLVCI